MKRTAKRQVLKDVVVQTECDGCDRFVNGDTPDDWLRFSSSHGEWGSDSIDSFEYHDVCSFACYLTVLRKLDGEWPDGWPASFEADGKNAAFLRGMLDAHTAHGAGS